MGVFGKLPVDISTLLGYNKSMSSKKEFITKDSGQRKEFASGMKRDSTSGKPDFSLIMANVPYEEQMLTRFAYLMARGAEKYGLKNWELANSQEELDRFKSSAIRHFMQWFNNEEDEDHAAAVYYNIMAYEATKYKVENSDVVSG